MIGVVTDESGRVAQWVAEQIGHARFAQMFKSNAEKVFDDFFARPPWR